jgi:hypothetical protein
MLQRIFQAHAERVFCPADGFQTPWIGLVCFAGSIGAHAFEARPGQSQPPHTTISDVRALFVCSAALTDGACVL